MVGNYVIIVEMIIMWVILVCVEPKENLAFRVESKIILQPCAAVVIVSKTILQNTKVRIFDLST